MEKTKKEVNMVAVQTKRANAQTLTCFIAFIATAVLAVAMVIAACALPVLFNVTAVICWISMALEAASVGLGFVAYWVKRNAL